MGEQCEKCFPEASFPELPIALQEKNMSRIILMLSCTAALVLSAMTAGCAVKSTRHEYGATDEGRTERRVEVERYEERW
jgi:hypothetical protein